MAVIPEKVKPKVGAPNKRAGYLLGGLSAMVAVLTTLGIKSDDLPNVWRNHEVLSYFAVTFVLAGVALGAAAGWILKAESKGEKRALLWGNALLGLGLIVTAWAAIATASDRPEPTVTATVTPKGGAATLVVSVENTNLKSSEDLAVMVEPLYEVSKNGQLDYRVGRPLYSATFGPDGDGTVKRSIQVNLPAGTFQDVGVRASSDPSVACYDERKATGCVIVHMPQRSSWPRLDVAWRHGREHRRSLHVHVTAFDISGSGLHFIARSLKPRYVIAKGKLSPTLNDDVDRSFGLPTGGSRAVCVAALLDSQSPQCPPTDRQQPGWVLLRVPRH